MIFYPGARILVTNANKTHRPTDFVGERAFQRAIA